MGHPTDRLRKRPDAYQMPAGLRRPAPEPNDHGRRRAPALGQRRRRVQRLGGRPRRRGQAGGRRQHPPAPALIAQPAERRLPAGEGILSVGTGSHGRAPDNRERPMTAIVRPRPMLITLGLLLLLVFWLSLA